MSEVLDTLELAPASAQAPPPRPARRDHFVVSYSWRAGIIVGAASAIIFALAAQRLNAHSYATVSVLNVWNNPNRLDIGGQWMQLLLIWLIKLIPGSTFSTLTLVTILSAAGFQGFITHDLVKRGWSPLQASLSGGLTALHPVMLFMATNGSPLLMYVIIASIVISALDRLEAIGDTQSLIVLGLCLAALFLSWPNALYFILPLLMLLPWAFRDIGSYSAAAAMFIIVLAPTLIVFSAVAIGGTIFEIPLQDVLSTWQSPMHGAALNVVSGSTWLAQYGGRPWQSFGVLFITCLLLVPRNLIIILRFMGSRRERSRPVTGLAALFLPSASGALATMFWHLGSPWLTVALSFVCASAWAATANFRNWERWLWIISFVCGVCLSWFTPLLWGSPDQVAWYRIMLGT